jgi:hypothetical protein
MFDSSRETTLGTIKMALRASSIQAAPNVREAAPSTSPHPGKLSNISISLPASDSITPFMKDSVILGTGNIGARLR